MKYCMECGTQLTPRPLEKEGIIPYCPACRQYRFPVYNTAVSMIVHDPAAEKILLIQQYGKPFWILVAGYINRGETAEHAVTREVREETGLTVQSVQFNRSSFFEPSNTLMLNFTATASVTEPIQITDEVDRFEWFSLQDAYREIKPASLARSFLESWLRTQPDTFIQSMETTDAGGCV